MSRDLSRFQNRSFDRGASRLKEVTWYLVRWFFFRTAFPIPSNVRCQLLRSFGAIIGRGVVIRSGVNISFPWRLRVGDHVWIGEEVMILSLAQVDIESNVCISQRAFLCTGSHDYQDPTFGLLTKPIRLEAGSWVAAMSFVGPGVVVGRESVCSAGAVVHKSTPPYALLAGNPAVFVRDIPSRSGAESNGSTHD